MNLKRQNEHRQDRCLHLLEPIDAKIARVHENGQRECRYRCVKCGRHLKNKVGTQIGGMTLGEIVDEMIDQIEPMPVRERALYKREMRRHLGCPEISDPDLWIN